MSLCSKMFLLPVCLIAAAPSPAQIKETVVKAFAGAPHGSDPSLSGSARDAAGNLYGTTCLGGKVNAGTVFKVSSAGKETVLHSFRGAADGSCPVAGVTLDAAGNLYGTTSEGGAAGAGTVFKVDTAGTFSVLYSFTGGADGAYPYAGVVLDAAGNIYGTTAAGGSAVSGVVFKINAAGQQSVLYSFTNGADGGTPYAPVILDSAGNLYGTAYYGGPAGFGVVYKLDPNGLESVLCGFSGGADGGGPNGGVAIDARGDVYGTTQFGGESNQGVVYRLEGIGEVVLHSFTGGDDGAHPTGGVALDKAGNVYGTATQGGAHLAGTAWKVGAGALTVLHAFAGVDGDHPGGVIEAGSSLYGATGFGGKFGSGAIFEVTLKGTATVLFNFTSAHSGAQPDAGVIADAAGNIYGDTEVGGANGDGVAYKIDSTGAYSVVGNLAGGPSAKDVLAGNSGLVRDAAGNLYGTTTQGGKSRLGSVFQVTPAGAVKTLYSFPGGASGSNPYGSVALDTAGNLYGSTALGGASNAGAVFKLTSSGQETVLYSFTGGADGGFPVAGVVVDAAGNVYGTAEGGGAQGVVYKVSPAGVETVLHSFSGSGDGGVPNNLLLLDSSGNVYGAAAHGGPSGAGVIFKLSATGQETVLYGFTGGNDGGNPDGSLIQDSAGNFYGVAQAGASGNGVVFQLSSTGHERVLYNFSGGADGNSPNPGLAFDSAGNLYGTTNAGGAGGAGVIFRLSGIAARAR